MQSDKPSSKPLVGSQLGIPVFKVTVHLQTDHFVEILIFRLMHMSKHELSSKKNPLKSIKNWQRNGV